MSEKNGGRILVIDDSPHIREIASVLLIHSGYNVITEEFGEAAFTKVVEDREIFDLLMIDVSLDDIDGVKLCQRIKDQLPEQPVIMMSGYDEQEVIKGDMSKDSSILFLQKPFDRQALTESVSMMIKN